MNTELVRAVFDCGIDDLRLLDDAECDMYAVIGRMREESIELTMVILFPCLYFFSKGCCYVIETCHICSSVSPM